MEGKTQETAAAKAGMSVRSARKWQPGFLLKRGNQAQHVDPQTLLAHHHALGRPLGVSNAVGRAGICGRRKPQSTEKMSVAVC